jgi:predicted Fe-Mo cluster-binding NifX family protein
LVFAYKEKSVKIAFSTSGNTLDSPLDSRFGRAARFLVYDTDSKDFTIMDNSQNLNAAQGAGIQSAQNVVNSGARTVVTGHCGPKAFRVLTESGVKIYLAPVGTVAQALAQYQAGTLTEAQTADVGGHWV